jgi:hypothetical protein
LDFSNDLSKVLPINIGQWTEEIDLETAEFGILFILFLELLLLVGSELLVLGSGWDPLSEGIVSVDEELFIILVLLHWLEEYHFTLKDWVGVR